MRRRKRKSREVLEISTAIEIIKLLTAMLTLMATFFKLLLASEK